MLTIILISMCISTVHYLKTDKCLKFIPVFCTFTDIVQKIFLCIINIININDYFVLKNNKV